MTVSALPEELLVYGILFGIRGGRAFEAKLTPGSVFAGTISVRNYVSRALTNCSLTVTALCERLTQSRDRKGAVGPGYRKRNCSCETVY